MNGHRQSPRRRWHWIAPLAVACVAAGFSTYRSKRVEARSHAWLADASLRNLIVKYEKVCLIPGLEYQKLARNLLGQRRITVVVYNYEDARHLLAMPACPVELGVETVAGTPPEVVTLLGERFGAAVE